MDVKQIRENARIYGLIAVLSLLLTVPAAAAGGDPTTIYELPMPVPAMPAVIDQLTVEEIPSISRSQLPQVSGLPSRMAAIDAAANTSDAVFSRAESTLNSTLTSLSTRLDAGRSLITGLRLRVGAPTSEALAKAQNASGVYVSYTAYDMATEMRTSIYYATAYLRGLSNLGGVGLNLTFIIIGLAWIGVVNLIDLLTRAAIFMFRMLGNLVNSLIRLVDLLLNVAGVIASWIDIITGPLT
jgi:hypothetical protein